MANIIFFSHFAGDDILSGADKVLWHLAQNRQSAGDKVLTVFPTASYTTQYFAKSGLKTQVLPYNFFHEAISPTDELEHNFQAWLQDNKSNIATLVELLRREQADLVHVNTVINPSGAIAAYQLGLPVLWHIHELFQAGSPAGCAVIKQLVATYADRVICASEAVKADFWITAYPEKYQVVHNGVQPLASGIKSHPRIRAAWRKTRNIPANQPIVAFLGSILHHKGVTQFIEMAYLISRQVPNVIFVIAGNPQLDVEYTQFLNQLITQLDLVEQVCFAGYYEDINQFLPAIDVLVVPTMIREAFGLVIIEAMAYGKPVVAFQSGGIGEIIVPGQTGYLVPQCDIDGLAIKVMHLLTNPILAVELGRAGQTLANRAFSLTKQLKSMDVI